MDKELIAEYLKPLRPHPTSMQPSGEPLEQIECVLFDIYGTLFVSGSGDISIARQESLRNEKLENLLRKFDIRRSPEGLLKDFFATIEKEHASLRKKGVDYPEVVIAHVWGQVLGNDDSDLVRKFAAEFEIVVNPVYPMPHLREMLAVCQNRRKPMGLISNAQFYTPYLFKWFLNSDLSGLGFHPDLIFFSYRFGYAKPSLFLFQAAVQKLKKQGIHPRSVLYVGNDMLNDIYPAQKVGFQAALFAGDTRSLRLREDHPLLEHTSADLVITDLIQLLDYL